MSNVTMLLLQRLCEVEQHTNGIPDVGNKGSIVFSFGRLHPYHFRW